MSKYHAVRVEMDGIKFDSVKEAKRYKQLQLLERAGEIQNLRMQVPFILIKKSKYGRAIKYIADFVYEENGKTIVEDTKGYKTDVYKLKKRIMAEVHGIEIRET